MRQGYDYQLPACSYHRDTAIHRERLRFLEWRRGPHTFKILQRVSNQNWPLPFSRAFLPKILPCFAHMNSTRSGGAATERWRNLSKITQPVSERQEPSSQSFALIMKPCSLSVIIPSQNQSCNNTLTAKHNSPTSQSPPSKQPCNSCYASQKGKYCEIIGLGIPAAVKIFLKESNSGKGL